MRKLNWRWRATALVVTAGLAITACTSDSGGDDDNDDNSDSDGDSTSDTSDTGDTSDAGDERLVVARTADIDNLDPHLSTAFATVQTLEMVYDSLFELSPELEAVPALAESFEYDDAGTALTIVLRSGVTFHDGSELDSADVEASLNRILNEDFGGVSRANVLSIESIDAPDELTVVLNLAQADATLPYSLAELGAAILPSEAIEADEGAAEGESTVGTTPNGTGAFTWDAWAEGQEVNLLANESYWGDGPFVNELQFRVMPDESTLLAGMQSGVVDVGVLTDPAVVGQVDESVLTVERTPALAYHALMLNGTIDGLEDQQVRQAIACAIDRDQLIAAAMFNEGAATGPYNTPGLDGDPYDGLPCDGPDVEVASGLLADAGYADGIELETIVMTGGYESATNVAQNLKAQLEVIGVDLNLVQLEQSVYVDRWLATDFDAAVALNGGRPDPHQMYARYFSSEGNLNSVSTFSSADMDTMFAEGLAQTDVEARTGIYQEIERDLLAASPWAWLFTGYEYRVLQPQLAGFEPIATGSLKSLRSVQVN